MISRRLIEDEYDLVGYTSIQINKEDGTIRYGTYILNMYQGPIFVEELLEEKRVSDLLIKVTLDPIK